MNLESLTDEQLLVATKHCVREERCAILSVLEHLAAIDRRRLHLERGYPSLFEMCVRELGYSAAAAMRRIEAMRLVREIPKVAASIEQGTISLTVAAQAQTYFRLEAKNGKAPTVEEKQTLLNSLENLSSREVERKLAAENPATLARERVRFVTGELAAVNFTLSAEALRKLERLKGLWAHRLRESSWSELVEVLADDALEKIDRNAHPKAPRSTLAPTRSGGISAEQRREVWRRAGGRCSYLDPHTGRRCSSNHALQVDHVRPLSLDGLSTLENLRLLCAAHNRHRIVKCGSVVDRFR